MRCLQEKATAGVHTPRLLPQQSQQQQQQQQEQQQEQQPMAFSASLLNRLHSSASAALSDRQRARFTSERLQADEETALEEPRPSTNNEIALVTDEEQEEEEEGSFINETIPSNQDNPVEEEEEADTEETSPVPTVDTSFFRSTTMTLAELEEERELARRRMSACVLLTVFVLFKLWIDCIAQPSVPLLMICLIGTSWTARWIRYNREREEELDRRIAQYLRANQMENEENNNPLMDRNDLRMLSFQAQLALAIMESQRHMMQGGRPYDEPQTPGVSDEARTHWKSIPFEHSAQYGSTIQTNKKEKDNMDGPHCSICLCEYEPNEKLCELPCGHLYHQECIDSWTSNHTKCPLCNFDLESVAAESTETEQIV